MFQIHPGAQQCNQPSDWERWKSEKTKTSKRDKEVKKDSGEALYKSEKTRYKSEKETQLKQ